MDYEPGIPSAKPSLATSPSRASLIRRPVDSLLFAPVLFTFSCKEAWKHGWLSHWEFGVWFSCVSLLERLLGQLGTGVKSGFQDFVVQSPDFQHPDRGAWGHWGDLPETGVGGSSASRTCDFPLLRNPVATQQESYACWKPSQSSVGPCPNSARFLSAQL